MPADAPATTPDAPNHLPAGTPADLELDLELPMAVSPSAKLVIERLDGALLVGWAHDPAAPGREPLTLLCGDHPVPAAIRRVSRADVARAVGAQGGLLLGFEVELPLSMWEALARHQQAVPFIGVVQRQNVGLQNRRQGFDTSHRCHFKRTWITMSGVVGQPR